jgi:hypothetical protein
MQFANARYLEGGGVVVEVDGVEVSIPPDPENRHFALLTASGVEIADYVPPAPTAEQVKAEAARRILARFPEWKQTNMLARGLELQHAYTERDWTAEEQADADAMQAAWDWIKAVRAASNAIEAGGSIAADFATDERWPG